MRNPYRLGGATTNGGLFKAFATPHQAATPPVRTSLRNRVIGLPHRHSNRRFASEPNLASQRQSLASVAGI
jgi:hypothetical protein